MDVMKQDSPFFHYGCHVKKMMFWTLSVLGVLAGTYSIVYDASFMMRWLMVVALGAGLEVAYMLLSEGRFSMRTGGSLLTAALLVMSVPSSVPLLHIFFALVFAIVVVRMPASGRHLYLNPMLLGRLFLMIVYGDGVVNWPLRGKIVDSVTTATPLELFHSEDVVYGFSYMFSGWIHGNWEDFYEMVPGGPGESFGFLIVLLGIFLFWKGILSWRPGLAFLLAFAGTCAVLREPVVFNVLAGAVIFSAVFIAGDPKTLPVSKSGKWIAGIIAGVTNALVRHYTFYSEGIVFSFLLVNLLSPSIDRVTFLCRSMVLIRRKKRSNVDV